MTMDFDWFLISLLFVSGLFIDGNFSFSCLVFVVLFYDFEYPVTNTQTYFILGRFFWQKPKPVCTILMTLECIFSPYKANILALVYQHCIMLMGVLYQFYLLENF